MNTIFWFSYICHADKRPECEFDAYCSGRGLDNCAEHVLESELRLCGPRKP